MSRPPFIAVIGAGIGGLTTAALLRGAGIDVQIYEQAARFARVGAGIQQSPNAMRVLRRLGLEDRLRAVSNEPTTFYSRVWDTAEVTHEMDFTDCERRFGAPYFLLHRGDLHAAIESLIPEEIVHLNKRLTGIEERGSGVHLTFADGSTADPDAVIGADGVHSVVRETLQGPQELRFTGRVAYRTTFPARLLNGAPVSDNTKWWGPDRHIVTYYTKPDHSEVYFVTALPEPDFAIESWSAKGDLDELRAAYEGFHPLVRAILQACPEVHKWAIVERDPLTRWGEGRITLLGDACHPMTPWMAQGAAVSVEDAAVLARCLEGVDADGLAQAFRRYEATRLPRTAEIQRVASSNTFMRERTDPSWVYGYDALSTPILAPMAGGVA